MRAARSHSSCAMMDTASWSAIGTRSRSRCRPGGCANGCGGWRRWPEGRPADARRRNRRQSGPARRRAWLRRHWPSASGPGKRRDVEVVVRHERRVECRLDDKPPGAGKTMEEGRHLVDVVDRRTILLALGQAKDNGLVVVERELRTAARDALECCPRHPEEDLVEDAISVDDLAYGQGHRLRFRRLGQQLQLPLVGGLAVEDDGGEAGFLVVEVELLPGRRLRVGSQCRDAEGKQAGQQGREKFQSTAPMQNGPAAYSTGARGGTFAPVRTAEFALRRVVPAASHEIVRRRRRISTAWLRAAISILASRGPWPA